MAESATCPVCNGVVAGDPAMLPFCSPRCKWVDLGRWLDGAYVIPGEGEPAPEDWEEAVRDLLPPADGSEGRDG